MHPHLVLHCVTARGLLLEFGGETLGPQPSDRIGNLVRENSLDLLQADHTLSGVDIALFDLLGKKLGQPVWKLLGYKQSFPKTPYASVLFGDTPQETLKKGRSATAADYRAAKFGWGPFGRTTVTADNDQLHAAREGLGKDGILLVDAGTVWVDNVTRAAQVLPALRETKAAWLEEPFVYEITAPRRAPALFQFMMEAGPIDLREAYATFNMGVGFCAVVRPEAAERTVAAYREVAGR